MEKTEIVVAVFNFIESELLNSSSSSDSDDEYLVNGREERHRMKNFITDVIHHYTEKEVNNIQCIW